jgi:putative membrane protein
MQTDLEKKYRPLVIIASIVIPVVVAALFAVKIDGYDLTFLPPIYAGLNGLTAIVLIMAIVAIKKGKRKMHERFIKLAVLCSLLFLVGYIAYHITTKHTLYGDLNHNGLIEEIEMQQFGSTRLIYFLLLVSHIILSIAIIPLVLITYVKGIAGNYESHKKWGKRTYPLWIYVAISGVTVYLMIAPFYK